jgi:hypothetical protein
MAPGPPVEVPGRIGQVVVLVELADAAVGLRSLLAGAGPAARSAGSRVTRLA